MLEAHALLMRAYEADLRAECGLSLAWYDVLVHLSEAPEQTLRMAELAGRLLLSPSWLTRRVEALEADGLVRRCRAAEDGRGVCVTLTDAGRNTLGVASRSHARSIREHFLAHLSAEESATIRAAFSRVAAAERAAQVAP